MTFLTAIFQGISRLLAFQWLIKLDAQQWLRLPGSRRSRSRWLLLPLLGHLGLVLGIALLASQ